jgi:hypothetical protein
LITLGLQCLRTAQTNFSWMSAESLRTGLRSCFSLPWRHKVDVLRMPCLRGGKQSMHITVCHSLGLEPKMCKTEEGSGCIDGGRGCRARSPIFRC